MNSRLLPCQGSALPLSYVPSMLMPEYHQPIFLSRKIHRVHFVRLTFFSINGSITINRFNTDGRLLSVVGDKSPVGIRVPGYYFSVSSSGDGTVWISNPGNHSVEHYNIDGSYLGGFGTAGVEGFIGCCNPISLLALSDGTVVAGEKGIFRVRRFTAEGDLLSFIAGEKEGELNHIPLFLDQSGLSIYISDGENITEGRLPEIDV